MTSREVVFPLILTVIGLFCLLPAVNGEAIEPSVRAEMVWSESDGLRHEIFSSSLCDGEWSAPLQITDDHADNLHPSLDIGPDGQKWAAWTAIEEGGMELRYSLYDGEDWQPPALIPSDLASNIKPSIMVAEDGVVWVVWSANDGGLDDIYFSRFRQGEWSDAELIHDTNQVPDILPVLGVDESGQPVASWQRYQDGRYVFVECSWDGSRWGEPMEQGEEEELIEDQEVLAQEIVLPDFVSDPRQVFIRIIEEVAVEPDKSEISR